MPKIRATDFNIQTGNVSSVTVVMPPHETGDLLLVFAGKDDATGTDPTTATSGWTRGGAGASAGATTAAVRAGWFWKVAASSAEPDLVITSTDADTWSILAMSIQGAHATPIDASSGNGNTDSTGAPFTVNGVTTNYANSLVVFASLSGGTGCPVPYPGLQLIGAVDSGNEGVGVGYTVQASAGATGNRDFYTDATNTNCIGFCVAVRDDGNGRRAGYWKPTYAELIHPFRGSVAIITGDVWGTALTNYPTLGKDAVSSVLQVANAGPTYNPYTTEANNATDADVVPFPTSEVVNDWVAFGYSKPFMSLTFDLLSCTQGVGGVVAWEYWNGSAWVALQSVTDGTTGFTATLADGLVTRWAMPANFNWKTTSLNGGAQLFYVRARCTTVYTTNPTISQVYVSGHPTLYDAIGSSADAGVIQFENAALFTPATSTIQVGGTYMDLGSTVTPTNKIICGSYQFTLPRDYVDHARMKEGGGIHVMFGDTSFNRKAWCIGNYLDEQTNDAQRNRFAIQWAQSTDTCHSKTTTAPTTIADVFFGGLAPRGAGSFAVSHMLAVDPANAIVNGGSSTYPLTLAEFLALGDASPVQLFRDGILMIPVRIGGDAAVFVALDDFTLQFPGFATPWSDIYNILPRAQAHYDADYLGFIIDAQSGDVVKMTNGKITSKTRWRFEVLSSASASATYDFTNLLLQNALVTLRAVCTWATVTFQSCNIIQNSAVISGCTFLSSYLTSNNPANISGSKFTSAGTGHAIEITTAGTYTFNANTFTGYAASDGSTGNEAIYNNSGGAVTINITGGGSVPSVRNGAGASTTKNNTVTLTVTCLNESGLAISGVRVRVETEPGHTLIADGSTNGSGVFTATYNYTASQAVRVRARLKGYKNNQALGTIASTGFTQGFTMIRDVTVNLP